MTFSGSAHEMLVESKWKISIRKRGGPYYSLSVIWLNDMTIINDIIV